MASRLPPSLASPPRRRSPRPSPPLNSPTPCRHASHPSPQIMQIHACPVSLPSAIPTQNLAPTSEIQLQSPPQQPLRPTKPRLKSIVVAPSPCTDHSPPHRSIVLPCKSGPIKKVRFNLAASPTTGRPSSSSKSCLRSALTAASPTATGSHPVKTSGFPPPRPNCPSLCRFKSALLQARGTLRQAGRVDGGEVEGPATQTGSQYAIFKSSNHRASFAVHPEQRQNPFVAWPLDILQRIAGIQ